MPDHLPSMPVLFVKALMMGSRAYDARAGASSTSVQMIFALLMLVATCPVAGAGNRQRLLVLTDIGGDADDRPVCQGYTGPGGLSPWTVY